MRRSAYISTHIRGFDSPRFLVWLRRTWPDATAKRAAQELGASPRTVENWLAGGAPSAFWLCALIALYGPDFLVSVMASPPSWLDRAKLADDCERLGRDLEALEARRKQIHNAV